ncbi:hypothetical protein [Vibrio agarivorans]|uniref:Histidine phosphatase family protein n=1 Tax=Vibrio agarivorans TaxID=153622 RepID=A0ABT7Y476_9VIBR|nr:hypothetical protein [Vibrio agarivorans]MDN2482848.1 hypothetical protein [Vibrio agarivorans]
MKLKIVLPILFGLIASPSMAKEVATETTDNTQRIIFVRHAEKPDEGLGNLTCQGLNRALLLPDYIEREFNKPDYIFAANPSIKNCELHGDGDGECYSYVRPLVTIAPTAIKYGMPVNAQYGWNDFEGLIDELFSEQYRSSDVLIAWEHMSIEVLVTLIKHRFDNNEPIPSWPNSDYDTVFELVIDWNKPKDLTINVHKQNFENIGSACPSH